jgi:hypothetical protein
MSWYGAGSRKWTNTNNEDGMSIRYEIKAVAIASVVVAGIIIFCTSLSSISEADKPKPQAMAFDPEHTVCDVKYSLDRAGWKMLNHHDRMKFSSDKRLRIIDAKTLVCIDYSSCNGKPPGCLLLEFELTQRWWERARLPARVP